MALSKALDTDTGAQATYWRVTRVAFDVVEGSVWYVLAGYLTADTRAAGKNPLRERAFTMPLPEAVAPEQIGRAELYIDAKTREEFAGASDA
jgi:hypothetical protein